jgi:hypothetical protein
MRPRPVLRDGLLFAAALAAGCAGREFVSPATEQGPPPFIGPPEPGDTAAPAASAAPVAAPVEAAPLAFHRTQESTEWVARAFKIQARYARVIAVYTGPKAPATVTVGKLDLAAPPGGEAAAELKVDLAVRSLQEAADAAKGGDLVAVLPGRYQGFTIGDKADAGDERYVHFKALGAPGEVVIDQASPTDKNWMVILQAAHHVIVQGFNVVGPNAPGAQPPAGANAGIFINGDFVSSSRLAHHLAIVGNFSHGHKKWGIHSVDSHTVLVQDNLFAHSAMEHSAYFSDGSDNYVIRRNVFFGSAASGLQVNVDPLASLEKLATHPALHYPPMQPSRAWALGLLKAATERFGQNAFPDGRGFNYIIEGNVMNGNGRKGGAAINLAGVRESLIQNNLVYGNVSSGIAEWDNGNPFDAAQVDPGPQTPADVTGADVLPLFGCFNNVVRNNTVLMSTRGRPALSVGSGSWGTRARNNILINDELPSIELHPTGIWRFDGGNNVLDRVRYEGTAAALKSLAFSLPDAGHSVTGVSRRSLGSNFVQPGEEPWVILEGSWWKLNPKRPDFHPRASAILLAGKGDAREMPRVDLEGKKRSKADIGAYSAAP